MINNYDSIIQEGAEIIECDWRLFKAQLWQESRLKSDAVSHAGAKGIAQLLDDTFDLFAEEAGFYDVDIFDPEANIIVGAKYMRWLVGEWSWPRPEIDRHCLALASYNAGLGNILKAQRESGDLSLYKQIIEHLPKITGANSMETIDYVKKILNWYECQIIGEQL